MILKYTLFILILIKVALSYKQYKFHELCQGNKFKTIFDKITNNKPEVKLNAGDLSAALIHHRWNSTSYKSFHSCAFSVKLDNSYYASSSGVFALIKKLNLRHSKYDDNSCVDFIRFTYKNDTSTRQICGNINTSVKDNLIRNFFDETSGEMRVEISIDTSTPLSYSDTELEVDLVFTAYSNCYDTSNKVMCSSTKCISDVLSEDNIINCPPPGCSDESECVNNEKAHVVYTSTNDSGSSKSSAWSSPLVIVPIVIVVVGALVWILCSCNKKKTTTNNAPSNDEHIQELRPTARSDLDSYLEFQEVRPTPPQHERILPYAPQSMPSAPRPMPSAPPQTGFKDDPPAYDALFNTEPSKRANV